jgi:hypothetical protein
MEEDDYWSQCVEQQLEMSNNEEFGLPSDGNVEGVEDDYMEDPNAPCGIENQPNDPESCQQLVPDESVGSTDDTFTSTEPVAFPTDPEKDVAVDDPLSNPSDDPLNPPGTDPYDNNDPEGNDEIPFDIDDIDDLTIIIPGEVPTVITIHDDDPYVDVEPDIHSDVPGGDEEHEPVEITIDSGGNITTVTIGGDDNPDDDNNLDPEDVPLDVDCSMCSDSTFLEYHTVACSECKNNEVPSSGYPDTDTNEPSSSGDNPGTGSVPSNQRPKDNAEDTTNTTDPGGDGEGDAGTGSVNPDQRPRENPGNTVEPGSAFIQPENRPRENPNTTEPTPKRRKGCKDPEADYQDMDADIRDDSLCEYTGCMEPGNKNYSEKHTKPGECIPWIYGCTTKGMFNYNKNAERDDNSCEQVKKGCKDPKAAKQDEEANTHDPDSCRYYACDDITYEEYWKDQEEFQGLQQHNIISNDSLCKTLKPCYVMYYGKKYEADTNGIFKNSNGDILPAGDYTDSCEKPVNIPVKDCEDCSPLNIDVYDGLYCRRCRGVFYSCDECPIDPSENGYNHVYCKHCRGEFSSCEECPKNPGKPGYETNGYHSSFCTECRKIPVCNDKRYKEYWKYTHPELSDDQIKSDDSKCLTRDFKDCKECPTDPVAEGYTYDFCKKCRGEFSSCEECPKNPGEPGYDSSFCIDCRKIPVCNDKRYKEYWKYSNLALLSDDEVKYDASKCLTREYHECEECPTDPSGEGYNNDFCVNCRLQEKLQEKIGCMDGNAFNYDKNANVPGNCTYEACTNPEFKEYWENDPAFQTKDGSQIIPNDALCTTACFKCVDEDSSTFCVKCRDKFPKCVEVKGVEYCLTSNDTYLSDKGFPLPAGVTMYRKDGYQIGPSDARGRAPLTGKNFNLDPLTELEENIIPPDVQEGRPVAPSEADQYPWLTLEGCEQCWYWRYKDPNTETPDKNCMICFKYECVPTKWEWKIFDHLNRYRDGGAIKWNCALYKTAKDGALNNANWNNAFADHSISEGVGGVTLTWVQRVEKYGYPIYTKQAIENAGYIPTFPIQLGGLSIGFPNKVNDEDKPEYIRRLWEADEAHKEGLNATWVFEGALAIVETPTGWWVNWVAGGHMPQGWADNLSLGRAPWMLMS